MAGGEGLPLNTIQNAEAHAVLLWFVYVFTAAMGATLCSTSFLMFFKELVITFKASNGLGQLWDCLSKYIYPFYQV